MPQQDSGNANPQIPESNHCLPPLVEVSNEQSSAGNDAVSTSTASSRLNPFEESPEPAKRVENLNPFSTPNLAQTGLAPSEASFDPDGQSDGDDISFDPDVTNTSPAQLMSRFATKMGAKLKNDAADKRAAELEAAKATSEAAKATRQAAVQVAELQAQLKAERAKVRQLEEQAASQAMVCLPSLLLSPTRALFLRELSKKVRRQLQDLKNDMQKQRASQTSAAPAATSSSAAAGVAVPHEVSTSSFLSSPGWQTVSNPATPHQRV